MKNILSITLIFIFAIQASFAQEVDRTKRPAADEARTPEIGNATSFVLDNGLKIFVVENSKLPRVSMSLIIDGGPMYEGDKAGYMQMAGQLMSAGTANKSKAELDEQVDFMGARLSVSSGSVFVSSLSKYTEDMMSIMADIVLNPAFNEEEFAKIKTQMLSGIESSKDDQNSINAQVYNALAYGKDNAFGEMVRFYIGCNGNGGNDYRGDVDEFRLWSAALTAETIMAYHAMPVDENFGTATTRVSATPAAGSWETRS